MASARYTLNIKPEDLIPDEPLPQTRKQKIQNWLHYHKWWFIGGALVLLILGMIVRDMVTAPEYDYTIGIVTSQMLPDQILDELSDAFATLADDRDGNGEVAVQVQQPESGTHRARRQKAQPVILDARRQGQRRKQDAAPREGQWFTITPIRSSARNPSIMRNPRVRCMVSPGCAFCTSECFLCFSLTNLMYF